ncbi:cytochrome c oxidase subunit II [Flavobacterium aquatile]|uniref:Cytochrome c oxidase subunit 2 n=1 Tax=Flavobacterium aquatile LMG 4008 = ATCC 11947 TaxID=1453498 RepID=A0A095SX94_9FLAO|nr:cytochrome c oxidase subunit II [Flavobacterium aquatile]KGD69172.1 cytochrome C oxidase subunit II [Flavobacterium aquatile LMG 4008 = ATCC 11947]OXA65878.1 cytochrome C oxidase subunit II [Flavobacterium aquatile LMG 4008 = ATCC 11947]GEC79662.1 cytochrome c oxidase subunit II [Flavobacterium aquatile]
MTSFLVLFILVLLSIAIWQLTKIFDLTQIGQSSDNTQIANDNDNKVNGYLMFAFLVFIYLTTIVCIVKYGDLPLMSGSASVHGKDVDQLMWISMILIFVVQTITQALLHYFAFKYRGRKGQTAMYFADNNKLEFIWSSIPAVVLAVLIFYGLYAWTDIMFVDEDEDTIVIELYAKQFGWEARYSGKDNVLGKANVRYIEGVNTVGVDLADPNAQDDIVVNELHLPKGKRVVFKIRSQDVLHSAYMPHFRAQMNCVPGMVTQFSFIPNMTTSEMRETEDMITKVNRINQIREKKNTQLVAEGKTPLDPYTFDYLLLCNKICGASHYNMQMKVVVDTPEEFKTWLKDKPTLVQAVKDANAAPADAEKPNVTNDSTTAKADTTVVAQVEMK